MNENEALDPAKKIPRRNNLKTNVAAIHIQINIKDKKKPALDLEEIHLPAIIKKKIIKENHKRRNKEANDKLK